MNAEVKTNEGMRRGGVPVVQHWTLYVDGVFIADTAASHMAAKYRQIADALNGAEEQP